VHTAPAPETIHRIRPRISPPPAYEGALPLVPLRPKARPGPPIPDEFPSPSACASGRLSDSCP
jgi:hypothetical protein